MKTVLTALVMFISAIIYSQEAYILTNNDKKIYIDPGEHFYDTGRKIKYYSNGNSIFPKTIKTEEVKEIIDGISVYKVYAFDAKKKIPQLYKIVATAPDKTLLVRFIEPAANASSGGLGMEYFIVDLNFSVLATGEIPPLSPSRVSFGKDLAYEHILYYFSACPAIAENLGKGTITLPDGSEKQFKGDIPLGFKVQKGIYHCN